MPDQMQVRTNSGEFEYSVFGTGQFMFNGEAVDMKASKRRGGVRWAVPVGTAENGEETLYEFLGDTDKYTQPMAEAARDIEISLVVDKWDEIISEAGSVEDAEEARTPTVAERDVEDIVYGKSKNRYYVIDRSNNEVIAEGDEWKDVFGVVSELKLTKADNRDDVVVDDIMRRPAPQRTPAEVAPKGSKPSKGKPVTESEMLVAISGLAKTVDGLAKTVDTLAKTSAANSKAIERLLDDLY